MNSDDIAYKDTFCAEKCDRMCPTSTVLRSDTNTTHVDCDAVAVEDGGLGAVGGEVPVELVAVAVPLDRVQLVALKN